jgi:hypothetical protein
MVCVSDSSCSLMTTCSLPTWLTATIPPRQFVACSSSFCEYEVVVVDGGVDLVAGSSSSQVLMRGGRGRFECALWNFPRGDGELSVVR